MNNNDNPTLAPVAMTSMERSLFSCTFSRTRRPAQWSSPQVTLWSSPQAQWSSPHSWFGTH